MIAEALSKIQALAEAAKAVQFVRVPGDPAHVVHVITPSGTVTRTELTPANRSLELGTIDDLIALGQKHFDAGVEPKRVTCFYSDVQVLLMWDHRNGREWATVKLVTTEEFRFFESRIANPLIDVAQLRQALKILLRKCFTDANLIQQISKLAFEDKDLASTTAGRGRESLGSAILREVQEPEKLPEELQVFAVRKFANPDLDVRFDLDCHLDPDVANRRWFVRPIEDSLIEFHAAHLRVIGDRLRKAFKDTPVRVFEGTFTQG